MDNTLVSKEWFDLDLWSFDLKINRDHLLIEGNPCTKFGIDQVKGSKDIEWTRLTDSCKTICSLFQGGHKNWIEISVWKKAFPISDFQNMYAIIYVTLYLNLSSTQKSFTYIKFDSKKWIKMFLHAGYESSHFFLSENVFSTIMYAEILNKNM